MKPEEALRNIGDWISEETRKRKYDKLTVIELSDSLITLKEALEKQVAKKPKFAGGRYVCKCGWDIYRDKQPYCLMCGQAIDWGNEE